ncbi:tetracycline resistance MFS efflux pump [Listeria newyorkensis]|uniref:Tetracycline resistance MFS efflux pump n=1 Tax=Listeria newyorkensis TaxID=1497681 RepID=A0ABX4XNC7_9LIST|nr:MULTISPECIES: tetracycline resistance MFS efflux pump [Listeria]KGL42315.1 MFS transporter [Listeriaceae bacterium FSL A5-0209]KGL38745.1 MFS transporter [Listeria newyorkensis]PNP92717.1 tetracycline resistance MFS efflux pump [Listeria newyorkensis]RQW66516.1 tetracycline resistance MFS efflux pump [Listeria sp. SHR_NRA_18]SQC57004.1 Tetracycline resistance protein, class C [Listeria newyorkensis]
MPQIKSHNNQPTVNKHALVFGLISVFLIGIGFSIITPVIPFLVQPYITNPGDQAMVVTLLMSVYAICMFFSAPVLGALSDRYGRRPILIVSLLGAAIGFFVFGIGGALWVLFAGRIIEGITGGSISTIFAYFADITPPENRTKYFGWVSAMAGAGSIMGPTIGGLLATHFGYTAPLYFGAIIALLNMVYGYFFMPESLDAKNRLQEITPARLNPFIQLFNILSIKNLNRLLIAAFLLWIPSGSMQAIMSQFTIDTFNWKPAIIGLVFSIMGFQDIISQAFIMPQLLKKLSDKQIALLGMTAELIGYAFIATSTVASSAPIFIVGIFIFGFGDSIFGPSFNGMLSKSADASEQGRIQGGSQSIQSLARIIGPILGGAIYVSLGHAAPAVMGVILLAAAILVLYKAKQASSAH